MIQYLSVNNNKNRIAETIISGQGKHIIDKNINKNRISGQESHTGKKTDVITTCTFGPMASTGIAGKALKMKSWVIYDSTYGNTKAIAEAITNELGQDATAVSINNFDIKMLKDIELLVIGSPVIGWKPTDKINSLLAGLNNEALQGKKAASFDTRIKTFLSGDAAKKIAKELQRASAIIVAEPMAFYVKSTEGPLLDGEIDKARNWANKIKAV